jgi:hypothetical protein
MAESDGEIDGVWPIEDLTPDAVTALAMRIQGSWTSEQLVYREAELDDLWRQAETARGESRRRDDSAADTLARVFVLAQQSHDLVGQSGDTLQAAEVLHEAAAELAALLHAS